MPVDQNIASSAEWFVGEDKALTITVRDANDAPVSITGWTIEWVLRLNRYHPDVLISKTVGAGITISAQSGLTLGQFVVQIDRANTADLKAGTYHHAAARTNAGNYDVISEGYAVLRKAAAH